MAKRESYMPFFYDWEEPFSVLTGDECKELLLAMVRYHKNGTEPPKLSGTAYVVGLLVLPQIRRAKEVSQERAEAGSVGGKAFSKQKETNGKQKEANGKQKEATNTNTNTSTSTSTSTNTNTNTSTNTNTNTATDTTTPSRFGEFWAAYPKKVRRASAEKAWETLSPEDELTERILEAVRAQTGSADWQKEGGRYIPTPAHWLEERRWEDELPSASEQPKDGSFSTDEFFEAALRRTLEEHGIG